MELAAKARYKRPAFEESTSPELEDSRARQLGLRLVSLLTQYGNTIMAKECFQLRLFALSLSLQRTSLQRVGGPDQPKKPRDSGSLKQQLVSTMAMSIQLISCKKHLSLERDGMELIGTMVPLSDLFEIMAGEEGARLLCIALQLTKGMIPL